MKKYQIVWWKKWIGIGRGKPYPYCPGKKWHGSVYKWRLRLGFFEIRRWNREDEEEMLYPTCSELVVALDLTDIEDIRRAAKTAEDVTGWKLSVEISDNSWKDYYRDIGPGELIGTEDLIVDEDEEGYKEINVYQIIPEMFNGEGRYYKVGLRSPKIPTETWVDKSYELGGFITLRYTDGYCDRKTVFMANQHTTTPHFEPLVRIAKHFGKDWHSEDGGSTNYLEEWLAEHPEVMEDE